MLGVEDVGCRRVVDDDGVLQLTPNLGEVLDVVSLVIVAALSEKPVVHDVVDIKLIKERIAILIHWLALGFGDFGAEQQHQVPWRQMQ